MLNSAVSQNKFDWPKSGFTFPWVTHIFRAGGSQGRRPALLLSVLTTPAIMLDLFLPMTSSKMSCAAFKSVIPNESGTHRDAPSDHPVSFCHSLYGMSGATLPTEDPLLSYQIAAERATAGGAAHAHATIHLPEAPGSKHAYYVGVGHQHRTERTPTRC